MSTVDGKDPTRYQAGLKATMHNPNVSDDAKESAKERLDQFQSEFGSTARGASGAGGASYDDDDEAGGQQLGANQERGYKATITNPNVSDQAKRHAKEMLNNNDASYTPSSEYASDAEYVTEKGSGTTGRNQGASDNRVLGGYKATVHNPNMSAQAKENAKEHLDDAGVEY